MQIAALNTTAIRPPLSASAIFLRYVAFAVTAGLVNLCTQEIAIHLAPIYPVQFSILCGTGTGFFTKYLLDKRFVFFDTFESKMKELGKITVYGLSGVGTTLLFWGIELGFWHIGGTAEIKYVGAVIGLSLGNFIKYRLDRNLVFSKRAA